MFLKIQAGHQERLGYWNVQNHLANQHQLSNANKPGNHDTWHHKGCTFTRVETRSGQLGHLGHIMSGSSRYYTVYKISGSDLDYALDHVC